MKSWKVCAVSAALCAMFFAGPALAVQDGSGELSSPGFVKNIIVMISDGCGFYQIDATDIYQYGETGTQIYESWPVVVAMSHYMAGQAYDPQAAWDHFLYVADTNGETYTRFTDSAAAATTMSTGVKTYKGAIGVDLDMNDLVHIVDLAEVKGKMTGVITSVQNTHATPAGFVAHNIARGNYSDIANEIYYESRLDLIMGCGHPLYTNDNVQDFTKDTNGDGIPDDYEYKYVGGEDTWNDIADGSVLGADANGDGVADEWTCVDAREHFLALIDDPEPPARVMGIARCLSTLQHDRSGDYYADPYVVPMNEGVPTLEDMTKASLNVLSQDPDGFFLMIEGGAVDWAGHGNSSGRLIEEEIDFNRSVEAVVDWVENNSSWDETLVIVTGDHETGYLTGPGSGITPDGPVWTDIVNNGAGNLPGMQWNSGNHTNALIPFFAKGRGAKAFRKVADEHDPVRGAYLDNAELAKVILFFLSQP